MPKKGKKPEKDDRMIAEYFKTLNTYYQKYGEKTILLWQCGGFFEIYCVEDPETGEHTYCTVDRDGYLILGTQFQGSHGSIGDMLQDLNSALNRFYNGPQLN